MVTSESWLAGSYWSLRSRFGTAASLAGIQNRLIASMRNWATNSQTRLATSGIEANRANRRTSETTIVLRRSKRSAKAPATGPSTIAGSSRNSRTAPRAKFCAAKLSTSDVAVAVIASRPSQSPKLDSAIDSHSRRKSRTRRTARIRDGRPTLSPPEVGSSGAAPSGTGAGPSGSDSPAEGSPSAGRTTRSCGPAAAPSSSDGGGWVGSELIEAPWVRRWRSCRSVRHGTGRGRRSRVSGARTGDRGAGARTGCDLRLDR